MSSKSAIIISLIFVTLFWPILFGFGLVAGVLLLADTTEEDTGRVYEYHWGEQDSGRKLLSLPIYGPIYDERPDIGSFEPFVDTFATYGTLVKEQLYDAAEDDSIAGVILEINSPGGTVTGSKAISDGVRYYQQMTGKPVYSFASGLFASGAYWAAADTDQIMVETGSLVGSIGVIGGQFATYTDVVEIDGGLLGTGVTTEGGIDVTTITAGEGKDFGNPYRPATPKELAIAQTAADQIYQVFVEHVASGRNIEAVTIADQIGAYVYGEGQALEFGLIDGIGNREQAYQNLASSLGWGDSFEVVRYQQNHGFLSELFSVFSNGTSLLASQKKSNSADGCLYTQRVMAYHGSIASLCN